MSDSGGLNLAYFAGVIDARGHIEIGMRHDRPQPRIAVTTRRVDLLQHLADLTGTTISEDTRGYERRPCGAHCKGRHQHVNRQSAKWRVDSARATIVLWNIHPFIVSQIEQVTEALRVGLEAWPAARGNTAERMASLGWPLPPAQVRQVS